MGATQTISATEFKAQCLDILDRLDNGEFEQVTITKQGRTVAVLLPLQPNAKAVTDLYGCMRGSVIIADDCDLTAPVFDEPFDAAEGILHR